MLLSRRDIIKLISASILSLKCRWTFSDSNQTSYKETVAIFVDILLPLDETPSATDLQVDEKILNKATKVAEYRRLLIRGSKELDQLAVKSYGNIFSELNHAQSESVVELLSKSENTTAKTFFQKIKSDAFKFYYTQPESWAGVGFSGPPQPNGFENYTDPP